VCSVDDVGILETIATAYIANVTVTRNRARGFLINNRQTLVEDCTFDQISGPALLMDCEAFFWWYGRKWNLTMNPNTILGRAIARAICTCATVASLTATTAQHSAMV
jgi:hypothetical protein